MRARQRNTVYIFIGTQYDRISYQGKRLRRGLAGPLLRGGSQNKRLVTWTGVRLRSTTDKPTCAGAHVTWNVSPRWHYCHTVPREHLLDWAGINKLPMAQVCKGWQRASGKRLPE